MIKSNQTLLLNEGRNLKKIIFYSSSTTMNHFTVSTCFEIFLKKIRKSNKNITFKLRVGGGKPPYLFQFGQSKRIAVFGSELHEPHVGWMS